MLTQSPFLCVESNDDSGNSGIDSNHSDNYFTANEESGFIYDSYSDYDVVIDGFDNDCGDVDSIEILSKIVTAAWNKQKAVNRNYAISTWALCVKAEIREHTKKRLTGNNRIPI